MPDKNMRKSYVNDFPKHLTVSRQDDGISCSLIGRPCLMADKWIASVGRVDANVRYSRSSRGIHICLCVCIPTNM
jgi:hypothetical protein